MRMPAQESTDQKVLIAGERCKGAGRAQVRGWPLNCDLLPLNIKRASRLLWKWPSATLGIEPPEALWPATKGQAASLARVRGHPLQGAGGHGQISEERAADDVPVASDRMVHSPPLTSQDAQVYGPVTSAAAQQLGARGVSMRTVLLRTILVILASVALGVVALGAPAGAVSTAQR